MPEHSGSEQQDADLQNPALPEVPLIGDTQSESNADGAMAPTAVASVGVAPAMAAEDGVAPATALAADAAASVKELPKPLVLFDEDFVTSVSTARMPGDVDVSKRNKAYLAMSRVFEKAMAGTRSDVPPPVLARWAELKGSKNDKFQFLKEFVQD